MLSRFTVRPDGRTPFQYLLGTPYVSPLCMLGESLFALIPDHEVRAAKLTNRWISGCWWGRDASSDEHLWRRNMVCLSADQFAENLLESSGADVKRLSLKGQWNFDVEMDSGISGPPWLDVQMKGCRQQRHRRRFPQYPHLHLRQKNTCLKF